MNHYAQLNEHGICFAVSTLAVAVTADNLVPIETYDTDKINRKYENGQWSIEKFEPQSTAPLTEFEALKAENDALKARVIRAEQVSAESSLAQQELLELLVEMEVI